MSKIRYFLNIFYVSMKLKKTIEKIFGRLCAVRKKPAFMFERDFPGVKGLANDKNRRLTVDRITQKGMADGGEMNTDLMGAPCNNRNFDECCIAIVGNGAIVGEGRSAKSACMGHFVRLRNAAADWIGNTSFCRWAARDNGKIGF